MGGRFVLLALLSEPWAWYRRDLGSPGRGCRTEDLKVDRLNP